MIRHSLIRPVSPAAILTARMSELGLTPADVAERGRIKPKRLGRILGGEPLRAKDVFRGGRSTRRSTPIRKGRWTRPGGLTVGLRRCNHDSECASVET